jgi:hypothetical protein
LYNLSQHVGRIASPHLFAAFPRRPSFESLLILVELLLQVMTYQDLGHDQWLRQALWLAVAE